MYDLEKPMPATCEEIGGSLKRQSIRENLENTKRRLTQQLSDTTAALEALEANPEVARVIELVAKAGRL